MRLLFHAILEGLLILFVGIFWCEIGYHYFVLKYNCSWPEPEDAPTGKQQNFTRILVLADTHIMGTVKSARIDKLRREWQMKQAFKISNRIYKPDLVVFLGDIFDEGSFSLDSAFEKACSDFERIFPYDEETSPARIIIPGNHDVGFHDQMTHFPHLVQRFHDRYRATQSVELIAKSSKWANLNIVASNSMSFYNDTCPYCSQSIAATNRLADFLEIQRTRAPAQYSAPILLIHIPLYRLDDTQCDYPFSLRETVKKKNIQGEDVLHVAASQFILQRLKPRLVLSGHTHMKCATKHSVAGMATPNEFYEELTISSYNHKYAEKRPGFLLLSANSTHTFTEHCNLIEEWVVVSVYIATIVLLCSRLMILYKNSTTN